MLGVLLKSRKFEEQEVIFAMWVIYKNIHNIFIKKINSWWEEPKIYN